MRYDVRMTAYDGTWRMVGGTNWGWERGAHTITWVSGVSLTEAEATIRALEPEKNPMILNVWAEPRER